MGRAYRDVIKGTETVGAIVHPGIDVHFDMIFKNFLEMLKASMALTGSFPWNIPDL